MRIFGVAKQIGKFLSGLIAVYMLNAVALSLFTEQPNAHTNCGPIKTFYLQYNNIHADVVFWADDLTEEFRSAIALEDDPDYVVFGLGDRDIYINTPTWGDLKAQFAFKALFLPSDRALHVEPAHQHSGEWVELSVCSDRFRALETYIMESFTRGKDGEFQLIAGLSYTGKDVFYEADGTYTLFNSCNNWANGAMKEAGVRTSVWSPFSQGVVHHARKHEKALKGPPLSDSGG